MIEKYYLLVRKLKDFKVNESVDYIQGHNHTNSTLHCAIHLSNKIQKIAMGKVGTIGIKCTEIVDIRPFVG